MGSNHNLFEKCIFHRVNMGSFLDNQVLISALNSFRESHSLYSLGILFQIVGAIQEGVLIPQHNKWTLLALDFGSFLKAYGFSVI